MTAAGRMPTTNGVAVKKAMTRRVLIVEDNLVNQRVLTKQLQKAGHTVALANHGQEALDHLQATVLWKGNESAKELDVILMDLEMPVMDGLTATSRIRELEANGMITRRVPIIAVTANARKEQIETCLQTGMVSLPRSTDDSKLADSPLGRRDAEAFSCGGAHGEDG